MGGQVSIFFNASSQEVLPFQQCAEKTSYCVNLFSVASALIVVSFFKRL